MNSMHSLQDLNRPHSVPVARRRLPGLAALAMLASALFAVPAQAQWTVVVLHPPGAYYSECDSIQDGQVVGYVDFGNGNGREAALWTGPSFSYVNLAVPGSTGSWGFDVQGGRQVGYVRPMNLEHAAVWSGTAASFMDFNPAGASESRAFDIQGDQVVGQATFFSTEAVMWSALTGLSTKMHPLGATPPYSGSSIRATDGIQQGGWAGQASTQHAMLWNSTPGSHVDLHPATGPSATQILDVNGGQQVGYGTYGFNQHAALWSGTAASYVDLNPPGATYSYAYGVHQGEQVGYASFSSGIKPLLWSGSAASYTNLNDFLPGTYSGGLAYGIWHALNGDTYVAGTAHDGTGTRAILWVKKAPVWTNLGSSLSGCFGTPVLDGTGLLTAGSAGSLELSSANTASLAVLFASLAGNPTPFKGGTLVPVPALLTLSLGTSLNGDVTLPWASWPAGLSGQSVFFQYAIHDTCAPHGVALSNALRGNVP